MHLSPYFITSAEEMVTKARGCPNPHPRGEALCSSCCRSWRPRSIPASRCSSSSRTLSEEGMVGGGDVALLGNKARGVGHKGAFGCGSPQTRRPPNVSRRARDCSLDRRCLAPCANSTPSPNSASAGPTFKTNCRTVSQEIFRPQGPQRRDRFLRSPGEGARAP